MNLFVPPIALAIGWADDTGFCCDCGETVTGLHLVEILQREDGTFGRYCEACGQARCTEAYDMLMLMKAVEQ